MKSKKGFVLTETLVVTVFLIAIFTFVYVSIIPLYGKYEDMTYRNSDIDIVYKLYNVKKMIKADANMSTVTSLPFKRITCGDLDDITLCNKTMEYLELNSYMLVYTSNIQNNLSNFANLNIEMRNYISKYQNSSDKYLVLLDQNKHTIAHIIF